MFPANRAIDYFVAKKTDPKLALQMLRENNNLRKAQAYSALEARNVFDEVRMDSIANNTTTPRGTTGLAQASVFTSGFYRDRTNTYVPVRIRRYKSLTSDVSEDVVDPRTLFEGLVGTGVSTTAPNIPLRFPAPIPLDENERLEFVFNNTSGATVQDIRVILHHLVVAKAAASFGWLVSDDEIRKAIGEREVPETILMEIPLQFPAAVAGSVATYPGQTDRLPESRTAEEHMLVLGFSTDMNNCNIKITDSGMPFSFSEREMLVGGQAHPRTSPLASYQFLTRPHFLARGATLQVNATNGYAASTEDTNVHYVVALCQTL